MPVSTTESVIGRKAELIDSVPRSSTAESSVRDIDHSWWCDARPGRISSNRIGRDGVRADAEATDLHTSCAVHMELRHFDKDHEWYESSRTGAPNRASTRNFEASSSDWIL
jgi:hypothetical protein